MLRGIVEVGATVDFERPGINEGTLNVRLYRTRTISKTFQESLWEGRPNWIICGPYCENQGGLYFDIGAR